MNEDAIVDMLMQNKIKLYEIEKYVGNDYNVASKIRIKFLEKLRNTKLDNISKTVLDFNALVGKNIENPIGSVQIPTGIAGPLKINGDHARGNFYIPLSTTEGALVASVNRGCSTITECGGANVKVLKNKMTRAPVFKLNGLKEAKNFADWIQKNYDEVKKIAENGSKHTKLLSIEPFIIGRYVYLRFGYDTSDAMGMNMVTIATENVCKYVDENYKGARCIALSSNMCTDKKPSAMDMLLGRGKSVSAEVLIPEDIVKNKLKTSVDEFIEVNIAKNIYGSALAGSYGFNAHFANVVAAIYLATGQDAAHIVEGSIGFTVTEKEGNDLYVSVTLPSLQLGTIGGGTSVATQQEALAILGLNSAGADGVNSLKFAEIVAASVLAGELSLISALAAGHLGKAHKIFGRRG